ncbi:MAG: VOC family protein [Bacteroidetes bacterium]|nr:VOC family protein [Bacteroidota bacterium]
MSETKKGRVTGIGGIFFKSKNPEQSHKWYEENLGIQTQNNHTAFIWKRESGEDALTVFSIDKPDAENYKPSPSPFMLNFRVDDLEALMKEMVANGVEQIGEIESFSYGKFGWVLDPDGNKVELWEPIDKAFFDAPEDHWITSR